MPASIAIAVRYHRRRGWTLSAHPSSASAKQAHVSQRWDSDLPPGIYHFRILLDIYVSHNRVSRILAEFVRSSCQAPLLKRIFMPSSC
jgi:hypothetical protein